MHFAFVGALVYKYLDTDIIKLPQNRTQPADVIQNGLRRGRSRDYQGNRFCMETDIYELPPDTCKLSLERLELSLLTSICISFRNTEKVETLFSSWKAGYKHQKFSVQL